MSGILRIEINRVYLSYRDCPRDPEYGLLVKIIQDTGYYKDNSFFFKYNPKTLETITAVSIIQFLMNHHASNKVDVVREIISFRRYIFEGKKVCLDLIEEPPLSVITFDRNTYSLRMGG